VRKALGLILLLFALGALTYGWEMSHEGYSKFLSLANMKNLLPRIGLFGILALGQSLVIITGGIDLSIGSVVGMIGILAALLMDKGNGMSAILVIPLCLLLAAGIGAGHGLLVTKGRMQPFVVTLCGLFFYRGIARVISGDMSQTFGIAYDKLRWFGKGTILDLFPGWQPPPGQALTTGMDLLNILAAPFLVMLLLAALLAAFLHHSPPGRHLFALGANEEAARFSGIRTERLKIFAYMLCSVLAGLGGLLFAFKINSLGPSDFGEFYELYAIAGAVLGGCSLRGGTGNVLGVVLGVALIMILQNLVNLLQIPSQLEYVVIGGTILLGVFVDESFSRRSAVRTA
jgi:ribose transport system permease protein